jgi:hypothetical protein
MPRCETEGNVQRTGEREVKVVGEVEEARPLRTDETAGIGSKDLVSRSCSISLKINRWSSAYADTHVQTLRVAAGVCEHSNRVFNLLAPPRRHRNPPFCVPERPDQLLSCEAL